ncbi:NADH:flavin oxidoreductase/NADH oxidase family protein [Bacillus sp. V2I10]|uniref:NADH:flavin oxidoreductase/NADH oxidase family protein n=1 Tax=Bacillus sp. V2I10 TaxID=3042276 RepID=UPI00278623BA|nr:NADH:flavin oxidoreductase/NADH oxidase family protein [Bacillus sp. V2I10]MDQ0861032.1 2,4-dienoyl-CoA reductase-like NADH-dependent reductase (Old Yellow Enzyme family) [Bacillus sp. V2I10]
MKQSKSVLEDSLQLPNRAIIKNRIFKSAMSEALGTNNQNPRESLVTLYKTWANGGAGLVVTGNVMIDRNALGEPNNVVVEDERDLDMLMKWAKAGTENETHLWMQLNHPGKQSPKTISKEPVAPSAVPLSGDLKNFFTPPRALHAKEIEEIIIRFGKAARIAKKAGFTGVQIHAAHGYLISQFLSPHHNQRTDEWGGSLANRMRFLLETYKEIRKQVGETFPIGIKLNSADFQHGGFTEEESMEVLQKMSEIGIDLIEISGGNYENPKMMVADVKETTKKREAYFIEYANKARKLVSTPLVVTGGFRSQEGMEEAIASGEIDMVGMAKPFALVPDLANKIFQGNYETVQTKPIRTGIKLVDKTAAMLEIGWYEQQLARIGKSQSPNPNHSVWISLIQNVLANGRGVFLRRRG